MSASSQNGYGIGCYGLSNERLTVGDFPESMLWLNSQLCHSLADGKKCHLACDRIFSSRRLPIR
ncbi:MULTISPECIES: hypothetical protein [Calothrix]|uniref:Uncharacterized protein n=2 Tax=Calothrix TaxID=1186 RepID=A0ABR8AIP9_9CYAN|nr:MULTISPECIES: hypothetical protein [Calothrix]MBD2198806.1 hypothetical protein [Calothrix parietina FACHB-288]MBD2227146.1 hypothetical protein [Calothrix anomala FACHB-343]